MPIIQYTLFTYNTNQLDYLRKKKIGSHLNVASGLIDRPTVNVRRHIIMYTFDLYIC